MSERCAACAEPLLPAAALCVACGELVAGGPPHPASSAAPAAESRAPGRHDQAAQPRYDSNHIDTPAPADARVEITTPDLAGPRVPSPQADARRSALTGDLSAHRERLREIFGYPDFRGGQARVLQALARGDVLAVMPTGSGKSLCYVLPALEIGRTVVVSPLIALMQDQVEGLQAAGVRATCINSNLTREEQNQRYRDYVEGRVDLLFVAPERFANRAFTAGLRATGVHLLAIDEAHCISEWGHNFRPDYLQLGAIREQLGGPRTLALTATANPQVRRDIVARLGFARTAEEVVTSVDRPNLTFSAHRIDADEERTAWVTSFVRRHEGASGILYARTRRTTEELASALRETGVGAEPYHAGMSRADRSRIQRAFTLGDLPVIVATNAFGMGIDKPDVRYVVHYNLPGRLEAYYQEAGRAGRDGEPAECVLLHGVRDISLQRYFIRQAHPTEKQVHRLWEEWLRLVDHDGRLPLATVENEAGAPMAIAALRASGLVEDVELRVRAQAADARIDRSVIDQHRRHAEDRLQEMLDYAETRSCRRRLILRYFGEGVEERCGRCDNCTRPNVEPTERRRRDGRQRASRAQRQREITSPGAPPHRALLASLREWRRMKAREEQIPAYTIAHDRTLEEIASVRPTTTSGLHRVWGLGSARVDRFGDELIGLVRRHAE